MNNFKVGDRVIYSPDLRRTFGVVFDDKDVIITVIKINIKYISVNVFDKNLKSNKVYHCTSNELILLNSLDNNLICKRPK